MANFKVGVILTAANAQFRKGMAGARKYANQAFTGIKQDSKKAQAALDRTGESAKDLGGILKSAKLQLLGLLGAVGLQQFTTRVIAAADAWKTYSARLGLATDNADELATAERELLRISKDTRTDLKDNITLYTRLAASRRELNLGQEQLLGLTESVAKAFQLSGATQAEAASGITQLSQALQSGVFRGDEFNSTMENGGRIATALTDSLGVTKGELREMAEAGELTATTVVQALQSQADVISEEFEQLPLTVEGAITNMVTSWERYISTADKGAGATTALAEGINTLAENFDEVARVATLAGSVIVAAFAVKGAKAVRAYVAELRIATGATVANAAATKAAAATYGKLGAAIKGLGWTAAIAGVIEITTRVIQLRREAKETAEQIRTSFDEIANGTGPVELYAMAVASGAENVKEFSKQVKNGTLVLDEASGQWAAGGVVLDTLGLNAHLAAGKVKELAEGFETPIEVKNGFFAQMIEQLKTLTESEIPAFIQKQAELREANLLTDGHAQALNITLREMQKAAAETGETVRTSAADFKGMIKEETIDGVKTFTQVTAEAGKETTLMAKAAGDAAEAVKEEGDEFEDTADDVQRLLDKNQELFEQQQDAMRQKEQQIQIQKDGVEVQEEENKGVTTAVSLTAVIRNRYAQLGEAALDYFNKQLSGIGSIKEWWTVLSDREFERVRKKYQGLQDGVTALTQRIREGTASQTEMTIAAQASDESIEALGGNTLGPLRSALAAATAQANALEDSAKAALNRYQDMVDRQAGNELAIEEREMAQALADLEAKLQEAKRMGNAALVQDLEQAKNLARQYHTEEIRLLREKMTAEEKLAKVREQAVTLPGAGITGPGQVTGYPTGVQAPISTLPAQYQDPGQAPPPVFDGRFKTTNQDQAVVTTNTTRLEIAVDGRPQIDLEGDEEAVAGLITLLQDSGARAQ